MNSNLKYDESKQYAKGYRYKIYPTEEQKLLLDKFIDANRYVYNWGLEKELDQFQKYQEAFDNGEELPQIYISSIELMKELTIHRKENEWLQEIPNTTLRSGLIDLDKGFKKYFKKQNNCPTFKSKKKDYNPHFHTRKDRMFIDGKYLKIEGIKDLIDIKFDTNRIKSERNIYIDPVVSKNIMGEYFISYSIIEDKTSFELENIPQSEVIGIDLNKQNYFALSTGRVYTVDEKKIKRLQKGRSDSHSEYAKDVNRRYQKFHELERTNPDITIDDIPMSNRAKKRKLRYDKRCKKVTNYIENEIHNITKEIIMTNPKGVVMEGFNVDRLKRKNKYVSREIADYSFGKCREIMTRKCNKYNIPIMIAEETFPSSKICSNCGSIKEMLLYTKVYKCPVCGMEMNRDINAAKNLANLFR